MANWPIIVFQLSKWFHQPILWYWQLFFALVFEMKIIISFSCIWLWATWFLSLNSTWELNKSGLLNMSSMCISHKKGVIPEKCSYFIGFEGLLLSEIDMVHEENRLVPFSINTDGTLKYWQPIQNCWWCCAQFWTIFILLLTQIFSEGR